MTPPTRQFDRDAMHRLIPSRYSEAGTVLADVADNDAMLEDAILLDGATNDRVQAEQFGLAGITPYELVYGIPHARIVNAAFTHANESGSRFNDRTRGAWYAAGEVETSVAEVAYHTSRRLAEIVIPKLPGQRPDKEVSTYDDWLADFRSLFHVLEPAADYAACLQAEPVPACYAAPQEFAKRLLDSGANGLVYPSVRRPPHLCLVCFRPALVYNPRPAQRMEIRFTAAGEGYRYRTRVVR